MGRKLSSRMERNSDDFRGRRRMDLMNAPNAQQVREFWTPMRYYKFYRRQGLRPANAYSSMLAMLVTADKKIARMQKIANWLNRR